MAGAIVTWFIVALSVLQCCLAIDKAHQAERRKKKGKEKKKDRRPSGTLSMKLRRRKKNETPKKPSMTPSGIVDYGQPPPATVLPMDSGSGVTMLALAWRDKVEPLQPKLFRERIVCVNKS